MAMVRQSVKMEEPVRTTTKILNLYNKSADPGNKTGSLVLTTTIPNGAAGSEAEPADFDASEITVIFEDEIETLYVGPVEITEEEELQQQQEQLQVQEAAAAAAEASAVSSGGGAEKENQRSSAAGGRAGRRVVVLNQSPNMSKGAPHKTTNASSSSPSAVAKSSAKLSGTEVASNGSDSGIDNYCDNKKKNTTTAIGARNNNVLKAQKKVNASAKPVEMVIKKRGRPPGSANKGQQAVKTPKSMNSAAVPAGDQKRAIEVTPKAVPVVAAAAKPKASISPRPQYECELCDEIFSREDTIVDHYQSYHRVDPKKRTIKPRVNIPREDGDAASTATPSTPLFIEVAAVPSPSAAAAKASPHSIAVKKEKKPAPGLICGKCNLTFRTILLLSRHVKEMHDKPAEDEDEEDEEDEEEEEEEPKTKSSVTVVPAKKPRGRPRKSDSSSPRLLNNNNNNQNTNKGKTKSRVKNEPEPEEAPEDDEDDDDADYQADDMDEEDDDDQQTPPSKRGRKRKFAESDNENEVVPKVASRKRNSTRMNASRTTNLRDADGNVIYVEVLNAKEEEDVDVDPSGALNSSGMAVYQIKEAPGAVDKDGVTRYPCPLCDMTFTRRYSLEPHIQRVHHKLRTKECPYCDRKFLATGDLTRHMAIHTNSKPYECSIAGCTFRFVSRSDLAKHELRHTAGVPRTYVCGSCDRSFERSYDLRRHQTTHKEMQVDFRSYKCDTCGREFTRRDEYRAHMYRHLGVKPHKCHVCGKPFVDMSNCAKHCKGHGPFTYDGPADPMECGDCHQKFTNQTALGRHVARCIHEISQVPVHWVPQFDYFEDDVK